MHVYVEEDIVHEYEKMVADVNQSGSCSVTRRYKLTATLEADPLYSRKFKLNGDRSIQFYADKIGNSIADLDPDKEFIITARNVSTDAILDSSTQIEGEGKDILVTNVLFDNPLTPGNFIEIATEYHNLDVSFYLAGLWEKLHIWGWIVKPDTQIKEMEVTIKFPETLPYWFTKSEIGVSSIPQDWLQVRRYVEYERRCLLLKASDLKIGITYKLNIDTGS